MPSKQIKDRVTAVRTSLGLSGRKFAKQLGYNSSTLSLIESGHSAVTDRLIKSICAKFSVNEEWLRTGKGDMFVPKQVPSADQADVVTDFIQSVIDDLSEKNRVIVLRIIRSLKKQNFFEEGEAIVEEQIAKRKKGT